MKRLIPYLIMVCLGALSAAYAGAILGHRTLGFVETVDELRIYPQRFDSYSDNTPEVWSISTNSQGSDPVTTNESPSFQSSSLYSEPCCGTQGRAFELVVNGYYPDGGFAQVSWTQPQNLIFSVENNGGPDLGRGFGFTINGDLSTLPGSPDPEQNLKVFDEFHNLPAADGVIDYQMYPPAGFGYQTLMITEIMYDYSVDGTGGGIFLLNVTDQFTSDVATIFLPCNLGATGSVVTQAMFGGSIMHIIGGAQTVELADLGSCTTPPTFGTLRIYITFAPAPP